MSESPTESGPTFEQFRTGESELSLSRLLALCGTVGLLASFLVVLYDVVETVGDPLLFYPVVLATLFAATILSRIIQVRGALAVGAVSLVVGMTWHVLTLDADLDVWVLLSNNVELLTGETVLRIRQADVWALTVLPTPVFVTWFLALRQRYVGATLAGGGMLAYLVLTGDAGSTVTLVGVVSGALTVAFGEMEAAGWSSAADQAVVVVAVMVILPLVVTVVPGGAASPVAFTGDDGVGTMEESVVTGEATMDIVGEVELTSEARFRVTSDEPRLWRTGSYDRYTGDGWIRTDDPDPLSETSLEGPPGQSRAVEQEFVAETALDVFPSAWRPAEVGEPIAQDTLVGADGGLELDRPLTEGERVSVNSSVPDPDAEELRAAGQDYPESVRERYTQLPDSTPERIGDRTEQITQNADSPFDAAVAIEQWLETNREYSLDVERPEGDIADAFLFEMDAGYCTYYATTMASMLRSQDIPARLVTGYTPGESVGDDEYLVRGLNSHVWVEVYFPDIGWVEFDPTPSDPRQDAELAAITGTDGGGGGDGGSDDGGSGGTGSDSANPPQDSEDPTSDSTDTTDIGDDLLEEQLEQQGQPDIEDLPEGTDGADESGDDESGDGFGAALPSRDQLAVSLVALVGLLAWTRQAGVARTVSRRVAVRFQRRSDPETDVERAYERLLLLLEERHRPRKTGETTRQYLADIYASEDAHRVVELYERARYGGDVTEGDADEAIDLVDRIRADR